jgi:hypothetical protein
MRIANQSFSKLLACFVNGLVVLGYTGTFLSAVSVLIGWEVVGIVSCLVLVAMAVDHRCELLESIKTKSKWRRGEKIEAVYFLTLVVCAIGVNLFYFATKFF